MAIINNSFKMGGQRQNLEHLLEEWTVIYDDSSDIDEYDHFFNDAGMLVLFFDHDCFDIDEFTKYFNVFKELAKKHQVDVNCTLMESWDVDTSYSILTYRALADKSGTYKMTNVLRRCIKQVDEEYFIYKDRKFHESDVPGVLFDYMLSDRYGAEKFELRSGGIMGT